VRTSRPVDELPESCGPHTVGIHHKSGGEKSDCRTADMGVASLSIGAAIRRRLDSWVELVQQDGVAGVCRKSANPATVRPTTTRDHVQLALNRCRSSNYGKHSRHRHRTQRRLSCVAWRHCGDHSGNTGAPLCRRRCYPSGSNHWGQPCHVTASRHRDCRDLRARLAADHQCLPSTLPARLNPTGVPKATSPSDNGR